MMRVLLSTLLCELVLRTGPVSVVAWTSSAANQRAKCQLHASKPDSSDRETSIARRQVLQKTATAFTGASTSSLWLPSSAKGSDVTGISDEIVTASTNKGTSIPTTRLGKSSLEISQTIQGYWQLAGGHGRYKETDALANMKAHYEAGITTLDTADIYGKSEQIIGQFVSSSSQQQSPPPVVCTKFCCFRFLEDINRDEVRTRILQARDRLQIQQLPLVQFFWSNYDIKRYVDVALYLTELKEEGLIREIGATNFDLKRLQELKKADVPIVSHQVQLSALDQRSVQSGMAEWCSANDISLIAFGTVASGILSEKYLGRTEPPTQEERNTASMRMYSTTASRFGDWSLVQELLRTLQAIAQTVREEGRCPTATLANVAQRYVLQTPAVAAVLIGVRNQDHLKENIATHSFTLTRSEMDAIDRVVTKRKGPKGDVWDIERGYV